MALANDRSLLDIARLQAAARAGLEVLNQVEEFRNFGLAARVTAYDDTGIAGRAVEIRPRGAAASTVIEANSNC